MEERAASERTREENEDSGSILRLLRSGQDSDLFINNSLLSVYAYIYPATVFTYSP